MANELALLFNSEARERSKELARISRAVESAQAHIRAIGDVIDYSIYTAVKIELTRQAAEHFAPSGAPIYAMHTVTGAMATNSVIARFGKSAG